MDYFFPRVVIKTRDTLLMFCWPCIVMYPYNKNQQDALFTFNLFQIINPYMFRAGLLLIIRRYFFCIYSN